MGRFILLICLVTFVLFIVFRRKTSSADTHDASPAVVQKRSNSLVQAQNKNELTIAFENIPKLTEEQNSQLVEIKDSKLLAHIDNAISGTMNAVVNSASAVASQNMANQTGNLYRAIIPNGAVLDKSRAMEGAFRGSYRGTGKGIKGNANWVPVDGSHAKEIATVNIANAAMGVASMVVGQYYMTQINDQLGDISDSLDNITSFQDNEYRSKVITLVTEVQKTSIFQMEIMENEELRKRELGHLKELETKCAELLTQANLTLDGYSGKTGIDYNLYKELVEKASGWYQYQQILLQVMDKIADLTHALNLGSVSREYSYGLFLEIARQSGKVLENLSSWHAENCERLKIDVNAEWRKRQGLDAVLMAFPGLFNDDLNYKMLPGEMVDMIKTQSYSKADVETIEEDLFNEDVQLIAKDGKLYYLPTTTE